MADRNTVCLLTPLGRGALAVVNVRGPDAAAALSVHLRNGAGKPVNWLTGAMRAGATEIAPAAMATTDPIPGATRRHRFARWQHAAGSEDVVVVTRGSDEFEICTHGGVWAAELVCEQLADSGFDRVGWAEAAAAVDPNRWRLAAELAVLDGKTIQAADWLIRNAEALPNWISAIESRLQRGETAAVLEELRQWLRRKSWARQIRDGFSVVIAGRPNVGKSTLFNRILGFDRAIVFDQPGSTRDVVSECTAVAGWPVWLSDTAGLRETLDSIEHQGVVRAERALGQADLVLLVSDRSQPWHADEQALIESNPSVVLLHNKSDLPAGHPRPQGLGLEVSLEQADSVAEILTAVALRLIDPSRQFAPFPTDPWQVAMIEEVEGLLGQGKGLAALAILRRSLGKSPGP